MSEESFSPSDMMAMMNGNNGMNGIWNNPFLYLIWFAMFGNGFGGFGGNSQSLTRAEMTDGFNNQNLQSDVRSTQSDVNSGFAGVAQNLCSGFGSVNSTANANANMINQAINSSTFANTQAVHDLQSTDQMGFCSVNNNINNLKYEMAQNCCDLKTAMHSEGEATRALIQANTIQDLRDKLAEKESTLNAANITLANAAQTQTLLNNLGKYIPAATSSW